MRHIGISSPYRASSDYLYFVKEKKKDAPAADENRLLFSGKSFNKFSNSSSAQTLQPNEKLECRVLEYSSENKEWKILEKSGEQNNMQKWKFDPTEHLISCGDTISVSSKVRSFSRTMSTMNTPLKQSPFSGKNSFSSSSSFTSSPPFFNISVHPSFNFRYYLPSSSSSYPFPSCIFNTSDGKLMKILFPSPSSLHKFINYVKSCPQYKIIEGGKEEREEEEVRKEEGESSDNSSSSSQSQSITRPVSQSNLKRISFVRPKAMSVVRELDKGKNSETWENIKVVENGQPLFCVVSVQRRQGNQYKRYIYYYYYYLNIFIIY